MKWHNISRGYQSKMEQMRGQDAYERLGVPRDTDLNTAKKAYIRLMKLYHPDKNDRFLEGLATEYAQLLNAAFEQVKAELSK